MKISSVLMVASIAVLVAPAIHAVPAAAPVAHAMHHMPMAEHGPQMHAMMARAQAAKTPAERQKLMVENMAMMKAHMAEMNAMMGTEKMTVDKPMKMPMTMDAAHTEKMRKHMTMMHQMMEGLLVQQEMLMHAD